MTNEANDGVECLTFGDIYALAGPESQGIDSWNDAEALASELGSSTDLPDASLDIVGPGEESGTFASFVELVIEEFNEDRGARSEEHTSELQSLMRISYAVFCLTKKNYNRNKHH